MGLKILLFVTESVLGCGIYSLIAADQDFSLSVLKGQDLEQLIKNTNQLSPDVIITEQRFLADHSGMLNRLLRGKKDLKVITLDEEHNILHVYSSIEVSYKRASDLISILHAQKPH